MVADDEGEAAPLGPPSPALPADDTADAPTPSADEQQTGSPAGGGGTPTGRNDSSPLENARVAGSRQEAPPGPDRSTPVGRAIELGEPGDSARRSGTGHGAARRPEPLTALASIASASRAVRIGGRETVFLNEGCHGATVGWLEQGAVTDLDGPGDERPGSDNDEGTGDGDGAAGVRRVAIEDLDAEPKTFTLDVDGIELGTRVLALDCEDPTAGDLELLVYRQNLSGPAGLGTVALVTTIGMGATAGVLATSVTIGAPPARRRRAGGRSPWFPHDRGSAGGTSRSAPPPVP